MFQHALTVFANADACPRRWRAWPTCTVGTEALTRGSYARLFVRKNPKRPSLRGFSFSWAWKEDVTANDPSTGTHIRRTRLRVPAGVHGADAGHRALLREPGAAAFRGPVAAGLVCRPGAGARGALRLPRGPARPQAHAGRRQPVRGHRAPRAAVRARVLAARDLRGVPGSRLQSHVRANLALLYDTELALRTAGGRPGRRPTAVGRLFFASNLSEALAAFLCSLLLLWSMDWAMYAQVASAWLAFALTFGLRRSRPGSAWNATATRATSASVFRHRRRRRPAPAPDLPRALRLAAHDDVRRLAAAEALAGPGDRRGLVRLSLGRAHPRLRGRGESIALQLEDRLGATTMLLAGRPRAGRRATSVSARSGPSAAYWSAWCSSPAGDSVTVVLRQALNRRVPSSFRATANSFASLGFRGGFALTAPAVGVALDAWGMGTTFLLLAVASLGICLGSAGAAGRGGTGS